MDHDQKGSLVIVKVTKNHEERMFQTIVYQHRYSRSPQTQTSLWSCGHKSKR